MPSSDHWNDVYRNKSETEVSWFQEVPERSLALVRAAAGDASAPILDVGGGASRLIDALARLGYEDLTVLDIAEAGLQRAKTRLGDLAGHVSWRVADITAWKPDRRWQVWHDRAVFHFLTDAPAQDAYIAALEQATAPGATVIMASFALDGPERCSGLPVQRYSAETLAARLGDNFRLVDQAREEHRTPWGSVQKFQYAVLRRR